MSIKENKWVRAAIPALLIHCSIGTVYCWSTFKETIANQIGMSTFSVGWAFSLAIFFLGMSAAFAGSFIERDIHKSSLVSCICFSTGFIGTGYIISHFQGVLALVLLYIFYGVIMGIGLGIGYLTPVKTLMLWFKDNKGLATGISIMGFGLAKFIATPIMELLQNNFGISSMFYILGIIYFIMMLLGHLLLKKPSDWIEPTINKDKIIIDKNLIKIWLIFFLNIHCGLALITYEKQLIGSVFIGVTFLTTLMPSLSAAANAVGRIGYATISDKMKNRLTVYKIIFSSYIIIISILLEVYNFNYSAYSIGILLLLLIINAGYGGGFSTLPALLSQEYGMKNISKIHGLVLSAWAIAGITGNNMSELILQNTNNDYYIIILVILILYAISLFICLSIDKKVLVKH